MDVRASADYYNNRNSNKQKSSKLKPTGILMALLPLSACGGDGGTGGAAVAPPPPPPEPTLLTNFTETTTNTFVAQDDSDSTLVFMDATDDLNITGLGGDDALVSGSGDDTIKGGDGDDMIRAGEGADDVDGGAGDDIFVLVGTTTAGQYDAGDITSPAGSGVDLSRLVSLADLNDRATSEVGVGEAIDGGAGNNTVYVYGTVDLTGITLTNVTVLYVNSEISLTPDQIADFTTIDGDGSSIINIIVPDDGNDYVLDLTSMDISDIAEIHVDGDITFRVDDASDLAGIVKISAETGSEIRLDVTHQHPKSVISLEEIWAVFDQVVVVDYEGDGFENFIIYNADSNFQVDAQSGFISMLASENEYFSKLYLVPDASGLETFEADLTTYDLTGISLIYLGEDGNTEVTITTQNIIDWYQGSSSGNNISIYGYSDDILNIDGEDWTTVIPTINSFGLRYLYLNSDNERVYLTPDLAEANGFTILGGFTETTTNVFEADGGFNTVVLDETSSANNLTITGNADSSNFIASGSGDDLITLLGTGLNTVVTGAGDDVVHGGSGRDVIRTKEGDDTIFGGDGRDDIYGGAGADYIDGGDGLEDRVNYYRSPEAVTIDLAEGTATGGYADGDTVVNIERVSGTAFDDVITGDDNDNQLSGGEGGNDILNGGGGNDLLFGIGELYGGTGDDRTSIFEDRYEDTFFDGGDGEDEVWLLAKSNSSVPTDFALSSEHLINIEAISLTFQGGDGTSIERLELSLDDVISMTDADNILKIYGGDTFDSVTSTGEGWVQGADQNIDSYDYHVYTGGGATLLVDLNITQDIT
tara:strand:+ start:106724 stop:109171 length:2448 start_codon:yes stop_codon:yes gene_type:complete